MATSKSSTKSTTKKSADESTPTNKAGEPVEHAVSVDDSSSVDRVAAVSYRADGSPDQTPGFEIKGGGDDSSDSEVVKSAPDDEA